MRWAIIIIMIMIMISRIVLMRSVLKYLIVAEIEIHKLTFLNIFFVLFCSKDSSFVHNLLELAIFTESREYCTTTDQRRY
jgi:hypothetical protein